MVAENSIVRKMVYAVVLSFIVGFILMLLKRNIDEKAWAILDMLFFQDISETKSFRGLGLFYIIGQLFMRGLQMMIVPLVISSLTLSLCNLADPKKLGRIARRTLTTYLIFYLVTTFLAG
ncbi:MAG TPA: dicarboxylate/amino acid:cation symporter, partial [Pasteurellaceae bacterium]|nr:dicarboxylate/amino acid:cation symporter [Pasteurellaceae bacterium]